MQNACPITKSTIDERAARLCALITLLPLGLSVVSASPWPALFLAIDFAMRGFGARRASPVARLAQSLAGILGLEPRRVNGGPKAFAAKLGFGFSVAVGLAFLFGKEGIGMATALPFSLCAILEGTLGYCVGCRLYQVWQRIRPSTELSRAGS